MIVHSKGLNALNMQKEFSFSSNFEHQNFASNIAYFKKYIDNCNYYVFLVIFQKHKNIILMNVTHLGGSFDHVFTFRKIKNQNILLSLKLQGL
jgi:hypothetical protein